MKQKSIFFTVCSFLLLFATSCTDKINDEVAQRVEPGVYYIEKDLSAVVVTPTTKGVTKNYEFDTNYDDKVIYLHKIGGTSDDCIAIPIINCPGGESGTCKGIRYRIEIDEFENATITPLNENEEPVRVEIDDSGNVTTTPLEDEDLVEAGVTLTLTKNDQCYFSSWPTKEWALQNGQWAAQQWAGEEDAYYFFYREKNINKELYRSGELGEPKNLDITQLKTNGDLNLTRACAGFLLSTIIYDKRTYSQEDEEDPNTGSYLYSEYFFTNVMGSAPSKWYIKMYLGGACFPKSYDIENWKEGSDQFPNGYYSTGDVEKFVSGEIVGQYFLSLKGKKYNSATVGYGGYGYLSAYENVLFSPVTGGDDEMHVYVLIKHWTGDGDPGEDWLLSDVGALQTEITGESVSTKPTNSEFIKIALVIEDQEFNEAWNNGTYVEGSSQIGDKAQNALILAAGIDPTTGNKISNSSSNSPTPAAYNTAITRSPSGAPVRTFTLPKDAIVIQEVY